MTWFGAFALFGVPLIVLGLGWAAVRLDERADRRQNQQKHAAQ